MVFQSRITRWHLPLSVPVSTLPTGVFPPPLTSFDINSFGLFITKGEVLAIVLRSDALGTSLNWTVSLGGGYPYGSEYVRAPGGTWNSFGFDAGFQTFVNPVPEPSTLTMFGTGALLSLGYLLWRRSRQTGA